ncbi:hypothetical protein I6N95_03610 [Vagococcus sp. BWB3-3]|uniref:Uncharacterized protein n=1 Tax=Vagococcus allomyrinae TaxID=2794353 RepID=A0A940STV5_9ENTE|nr:hypothetical protein [Vagococcus allomyrinae]MBP1040094.1 hypothetical protein [Vagococcus allomyrinae]
MRFLGMTLPELAALFGMISLVVGAMMKFYHMVRFQITAPLIEALDKLRIEISQLEEYLIGEYRQLKDKTEQLEKSMSVYDHLKAKEGYHDCPVADRS